MVNQKLVSLKIDLDLLVSLDQWCDYFSVKRNRFINDLIRSSLANPSTYQISRIIARYQPDLLPLWYKIEYDLDFDNDI